MPISPTHEVMISAIADLILDDGHAAVGAASPIPAAAALLARELSGKRLRVSLLGSRAHNPFTEGGRELFDCAAQGRIDVFFLSGLQIDGSGNVNSLGTGSIDNPERRFSGHFGSPFMMDVVPKIILFKEPHDRRNLVERVDIITARGSPLPGVWRRGGPRHLITDRCLFDFVGGRFRLRSLHPGQTLADVRDETGFSFDHPPAVPETTRPDSERIGFIRGPLIDLLAETYPSFVDTIR